MQIDFRSIKEFLMYRKEHFISIFVFSVIATLILGVFAPVFSENGAETQRESYAATAPCSGHGGRH